MSTGFTTSGTDELLQWFFMSGSRPGSLLMAPSSGTANIVTDTWLSHAWTDLEDKFGGRQAFTLFDTGEAVRSIKMEDRIFVNQSGVSQTVNGFYVTDLSGLYWVGDGSSATVLDGEGIVFRLAFGRQRYGPRVSSRTVSVFNVSANMRGVGSVQRDAPGPTTTVNIQTGGNHFNNSTTLHPDKIKDSVGGQELDTTVWTNNIGTTYDDLTGTAWPADGAIIGAIRSPTLITLIFASEQSGSNWAVDNGVEMDKYGGLDISTGRWTRHGYNSAILGFFTTGTKLTGLEVLPTDGTEDTDFKPQTEVLWANKSWAEPTEITRGSLTYAATSGFVRADSTAGTPATIADGAAVFETTGAVMVDGNNDIVLVSGGGQSVSSGTDIVISSKIDTQLV